MIESLTTHQQLRRVRRHARRYGYRVAFQRETGLYRPVDLAHNTFAGPDGGMTIDELEHWLAVD